MISLPNPFHIDKFRNTQAFTEHKCIDWWGNESQLHFSCNDMQAHRIDDLKKLLVLFKWFIWASQNKKSIIIPLVNAD